MPAARLVRGTRRRRLAGRLPNVPRAPDERQKRSAAMTADPPQDTRHVGLARAGEPEEVANLIVFLASEEPPFATGAEFLTDGGETAGMVSNPPK
jgi:NAD(P)-dependent dehydrogenase (short-subunit alcohol dehydrogenase family)